MKEAFQQYRCRVCDNASWQQEKCHEALMEKTCFCGSGKFIDECHGAPAHSNHQDQEA